MKSNARNKGDNNKSLPLPPDGKVSLHLYVVSSSIYRDGCVCVPLCVRRSMRGAA
jgi:hypothetical protein